MEIPDGMGTAHALRNSSNLRDRGFGLAFFDETSELKCLQAGYEPGVICDLMLSVSGH